MLHPTGAPQQIARIAKIAGIENPFNRQFCQFRRSWQFLVAFQLIA